MSSVLEISLIPLDREHLEQTRIWANDAELNELLLRTMPVSRWEQELWFEKYTKSSNRKIFAGLTPDNIHIANTGFNNIDMQHRKADFWILIGDARYRGKHLGEQIVNKMLTFAFNVLNLNKVALSVDAFNERALKLYKRCGFGVEGHLRQDVFIRGVYRDVVKMSILASEFSISS